MVGIEKVNNRKYLIKLIKFKITYGEGFGKYLIRSDKSDNIYIYEKSIYNDTDI